MRVLFLTGEYPPQQGGIADYTAHLLHHLRRVKLTPAVLIDRGYPQSDSNRDDIPIYPALRGWNWRLWPDFRRFWLEHQAEVLHIQYQAAAFDLKGWVNWLPWFVQQWRPRPRLVTTFHDLRVPYLFPKAGGLRQQAILTLARHSDAVICTNPGDAAVIRQQPWSKPVKEIPLGHNIDRQPPANFQRAEWRQRLNLPTPAEETFVLAHFGFLNRSKGGETMLAVLRHLLDSGRKVHLLLIGGTPGESDPTNAAYAQQLHREIERLGLEKHVTQTGYVSPAEVSAYLLSADAALLPYRDGVSFRRTTLLAMLRHGLPVISTEARSPLPESATAALSLAPVDDVAALSQAVINLQDKPAQAQAMAQAAENLARHFEWPAIAQAHARLYRELERGA